MSAEGLKQNKTKQQSTTMRLFPLLSKTEIENRTE